MNETANRLRDITDNRYGSALEQADLQAIDAEVRLFKALADPTRLGILQLLASSDESVCVCDIVEHFPLNQPTISHHLRLLRETGLVSTTKCGTWVYYSLCPSRIEEVRTMLARLLHAVSV